VPVSVCLSWSRVGITWLYSTLTIMTRPSACFSLLVGRLVGW
jgi:hypothetical protein